MKKYFFLLPAIALLAYSCGCGSKKNKIENSISNKEIFTGANGEKFIHNEDAEWKESWSKENMVVVHFPGEPATLHPSNGGDEPRNIINQYTQKYLMRYGLEKLNFVPDLAKDYPTISANKLEYTYELRPEAKWDNGEAITAKDIEFTFKVLKCPLVNNPQSKSYLENLKDVVLDKSNPLKFTLVMVREYVQNADFMIDYPMLQKTFFDKQNVLDKFSLAQFSDKNFKAENDKNLSAWATAYNDAKYGMDVAFMTGAGPYKVVSWEHGQSIILEKKKNYWAANSDKLDDKALPEKIIFKINKDPNSTLLEFKSQKLDVSSAISIGQLFQLRSDSNFNSNYHNYFLNTFNYTYVALNTKPDGVKHKKIMTDKNVRRALALLTPVDDILNVVFKGVPKRMVSVVSPMKKEYNVDLSLIAYDIEKAKKILDDAGWKDSDGDGFRDKMVDGKKVKMEMDINILNNQVEWKDMATMIAESYAKAGIKLNLNAVELPVWKEKCRAHDFDLAMGVWGGYSGADDFSQLWKTEAWEKHGDNYSGFGDANSDALIDSCRFTVDDTKRIPMVKRFQKMVYDEQPYILLNANTRRVVLHKRFGNSNIYLQKPYVALNNLKLLFSGGNEMKNGVSAN